MTSKRLNACEVAVIGAGPYGLSVAAHLNHAGVATRVFGEPMSFWRQHMPKGMKLRSPQQASHMSDAEGVLSLDAYADEHDLDAGKLLPVEDFVAYGEWFQAHAVPEVDRRSVRRIEGTGNGFQLELSGGEIFGAARVVMAVGLANQDYRPPAFRDLPAAFVTHTCEHADFAPFRGKRVGVIGRGQSACESAVLLAEAGAEVELICRGDIHWLGATAPSAGASASAHKSPTWRDVLAAPSAVGPFPLSWLAELPGVTRHFPFAIREELSKRCLKPGAAGWLKPRFANVRLNQGRTIVGARALPDRIVIDFDSGSKTFDHVILGTGYRIDLWRIGILSPRLLNRIACVKGSPLLGAGFESTAPKLHFVGSAAVKSFGPLLRFVAGAHFAARSVTKAALARTTQDDVIKFPNAILRMSGRAAPDLLPPR